MAKQPRKMPGCPVNETIEGLQETIAAGIVDHPRNRRIAEEILALLRDVAWGRAGEGHIPAIASLATDLGAGGADGKPGAAGVADVILQALAEHAEVFASHVETHNCASGQCVRLAPAPCQMACPAGIDVPSYVALIGQGRYAEAIELIRKDNPFPWVCGLVCTRPCEFMCVRGRIDQPVSIKSLKGFAAERAMSEGIYVNPPREPDTGKKVCVIGAGPGGMSCAYYLALKGHAVRVIEALPTAGGMMTVGIPRYRLPLEVIDREVALLTDLGIEFCFNTRFGRDVTLESLKAEGFESFFFAIGAHRAYRLNIPGEREFGGTDAIDLLRRVALGERKMPGRKVLVIGGGNVAIDAARTCLRLGSREVTIVYRRTRAEMPADVEEVVQAEEEGIRLAFLTLPDEVIGKDGRIIGLQCRRARLEAREGSGRMSPVPIDGSEFIMDADAIVSAIGQQVDRDCLAELSGINWTHRNTIEVDTVSMETAVPGIFAAGDSVTGPATVIEAIGGGKRAAEAIDRYLTGIPQPKMPPVPVRRMRAPYIPATATEKMILRRPEMPLLNIDRRRTTFQQVELGYGETDARSEAARCLRCDICRRCGACVAICRDQMNVDALQIGYLDFDNATDTDFRLTRERCILCGACANNCPNGAMTIEDKNSERVLSFCGTELNRQRIVYCSSCGAPLGPLRYLTYVRQRVRSIEEIRSDAHLCDACLRKKNAVDCAEITNVAEEGKR